jgi:hypothetical protein
MGSKIYTKGRNSWMTDVWIKPLADGSFAVALINKDGTEAHSVSLRLSGDWDGDFYSGPTSGSAAVRDVGASKDLGDFHGTFNTTVRNSIAEDSTPYSIVQPSIQIIR